MTTLDALLGGARPPAGRRAGVVVTFDDGYVDNLEVAAPIAARLGIPFTRLRHRRPRARGSRFWWDELAELVLAPSRETLTVTSRRTPTHGSHRDEAERLRACVELHGLLRPLPESSRARGLDALARAVPPTARRRARRETARRGRATPPGSPRPGVTVGSHTVTHPTLTSLAPAEREGEIAGSRRELEQLLGHEVDLFSYPYGRGSDLDAATVRMAAAAGYGAACTTVQARVAAGSRRHALPRLTVLDATPEQLARTLERLPPRGHARSLTADVALGAPVGHEPPHAADELDEDERLAERAGSSRDEACPRSRRS